MYISPQTLQRLPAIKIYMGIYRLIRLSDIPEISQHMFEENQAKEAKCLTLSFRNELCDLCLRESNDRRWITKRQERLWTTDGYGQRILIINHTQRILKICSQANWKASLVTVECSENEKDIFGFTNLQNYAAKSK